MTQRSTNLKRIIALLAVIAISLACLAGCATTAEGEKDITVTVVYEDEDKKVFEINTDALYLADALANEGLITYVDDGLYTEIDGVTADFNKDGAWWCLTKDGVMTTEGFNTQPIADGDKFEITYTID